MKTDYRKHEIPARQVIERIFIAEDGKRFSGYSDAERDCKQYEARFEYERMLASGDIMYKTCNNLEEEFSYAYFITRKEDFEIVKNYLLGKHKVSYDSYQEFENADWYIFTVRYGGDYEDELNCESFTDCAKRINEFAQQFE